MDGVSSLTRLLLPEGHGSPRSQENTQSKDAPDCRFPTQAVPGIRRKLQMLGIGPSTPLADMRKAAPGLL